MTELEFHEKYFTLDAKPPFLRDIDRAYFEAIEKARKENKDLVFIKRRGRFKK